MKTSTDFHGRTTVEAIENAAKELGLDRDDFSCEVIENPRPGFLGIGKSDAIVRVTYEVLKGDLPDIPVESAKKVAPQAPARAPQAPARAPQAPARAPQAPARAPQAPARAPQAPARAPQAPHPASVATSSVVAAHVENHGVRTPVKDTPAEKFLLDTLKIIGIHAQATSSMDESENTIYIEISGANMGTVIGRRGETLDALQYLSTIVTNKTEDSRWRVVLDTENYRQKRVGSLISLANKTASNVLKFGKSVALEPMNPQERRIIHAALQENKLITTYSTGVEPRRKVIVALASDDKRPKKPAAPGGIKKK